MIRLRSEKCGQSHPGKAGHRRPAEEAQVANASDNAPFDVAAARQRYMRAYMRKRRERERAVIGEPPVERPPIRGRRPPPPRERKVRWGARAEALKAVAEDMIDDKPRTMMERLAQDYERMAMTAPGYWMAQAGMFHPAVEVYLGGVLRPAIEAYLDGGEMTSTELMALQAYLKRSITVPNCRGEGVAGLRERVEGLDTREKLKEWLGDALDIGIDTL